MEAQTLLDTEPTVTVERPPTPAIWIDSSVIIKLWKLRRGENIPAQDVERIRRLAELVGKKVVARKLLCVESRQREEFTGRAELDILSEFRSLTFGVDLRSELTVREFQTEVAMRAFLAGKREITVPLRVFFDRSPEREVDQVQRDGYLITAMMPSAEELVSHRAERKAELNIQLEDLRKKQVAAGVTYDAQLEEERRGYAQAAAALFHKATSPDPTFWDALGITALTTPFRNWKELGGDIRQFPPFMISRYLHALPIHRIQAQLFAKLVTSNDRIKSGDSNDIGHLALVLPVASFVVTDKAMERLVKILRLDSEWGARVFSLSSSDDLFAALEAL